MKFSCLLPRFWRPWFRCHRAYIGAPDLAGNILELLLKRRFDVVLFWALDWPVNDRVGSFLRVPKQIGRAHPLVNGMRFERKFRVFRAGVRFGLGLQDLACVSK